MMAKYTFLLPAYKCEFLDSMLKSIQNQSYTNYKVIISDDCSPEPIYDVCKPYLADARFSYRKNKENMGKSSLITHWNLLLGLCDTDYFIMASDDDIYAPSFLQEIDTLTVKYNDCHLYRAKTAIIDANGNVIVSDPLLEEHVNEIEFASQIYNNRVIRCIPNYVFKTQTMCQHHGFVDFPLAWFADTATALREAGNGCVNTKDILFYFRQSGANLSSTNATHFSSMKIEALIQYNNWFKKWFSSIRNREGNSYDAYFDYIYSDHTDYLNKMIGYDIYRCSWREFIKCCKNLKKNGFLVDHYYLYYFKWRCWRK